MVCKLNTFSTWNEARVLSSIPMYIYIYIPIGSIPMKQGWYVSSIEAGVLDVVASL